MDQNAPVPPAQEGLKHSPFVLEFLAFMRLVVTRFGREGGMRIAAALSYTSLLALVPLGAIAFAILKAFPVFDDIQDQIKSLVFKNFLPDSVANAEAYFDQFITQTQSLTAVGIVALAVTAIMLLNTIEGALNTIFQVKAKRPFLPRMLMFWAVITLGPLLLGGSLSLRTYLYSLTEWTGVDAIPGIGGFMTSLLPSVMGIFAFSMFYLIVPYRPVRLVHALIGGISAGLLFGILRQVFALYFAAFPAYQTIYGALATIPIFLIWMYLSWALVLIGAVVAASLNEWGRAHAAETFDALPPARKLDAALVSIERLWRKGRGEDKIIHPTANPKREDILAQSLEALRMHEFVGMSDDGDWYLKRDPEVLTIAALANGMGLAPNPGDLPVGGPPWRGQLKESLGGLTGKGYGLTLRVLFEGNAET
ncbi:YihY family inner membrane protein [Magnetovibrio sp. PR-2]|uniref:YihY family inner membrane protein n=1 Tax=Magnetovibrio sp. PR-2 TaxID=3120356 RepID=UPI002FCDF6E2